ncbi:MAG: D-glycero-alpha-D-manno-heptose-1,7-bisphosphate 7-phosphatase [Verrucomicrobiia bacterium]|jgi:D,D-heptose 1,7-bisphosphate phosphatase
MNSQKYTKKAVFLDRDGVIIEEKNYLHKIEDVVFIKNAAAALKQLQNAGFLLIIVTNQSGVGRGYFTMEDVNKVNEFIKSQLKKEGVHINEIYVAPEAPEQPSVGRKPSPAFLFEARDKFQIDLSKSFVVGDKLADIECGWNAGVKKSILVLTGYGKKTQAEYADRLKDAVVLNDLSEAANWILNSENLNNVASS